METRTAHSSKERQPALFFLGWSKTAEERVVAADLFLMDRYFRSVVLFSDDQGTSWTVGQLLPQGWTECQVAEMSNGSLLMTSRMYGPPYLSSPPKRTDRRRGFARSDDGESHPAPGCSS